MRAQGPRERAGAGIDGGAIASVTGGGAQALPGRASTGVNGGGDRRCNQGESASVTGERVSYGRGETRRYRGRAPALPVR